MTFLRGENKAEVRNKGEENTLILWREMRDRGEIMHVYLCEWDREGETKEQSQGKKESKQESERGTNRQRGQF